MTANLEYLNFARNWGTWTTKFFTITYSSARSTVMP